MIYKARSFTGIFLKTRKKNVQEFAKNGRKPEKFK